MLTHANCEQVIGQGKIKLRSDDPVYLELVDRWWNVLLPKIGRFLYKRGGNILMVQVCALSPSPLLPSSFGSGCFCLPLNSAKRIKMNRFSLW